MSELSDLILNELKKDSNQKSKETANKFNFDRESINHTFYSVLDEKMKISGGV